MSKKILIATPLYPPDIGGPATYAKTLEIELPKRGLVVSIVSFSSVRHLPKGFSHLAYFFKLLKAAWRADLIFALDPISVGLPAHAVSKLLGKPLYVKIVGDFAWEQLQIKIKNNELRIKGFVNLEKFQTEKFDFLTELRRWVERHVAKSANKVIVPSEYLKTIVKQWGVKEEKISVIYNAFDSDNSTFLRSSNDELREGTVELSKGVWGTKEELRKKFGWNKKIVISAGRDVPWKGFALLREVMEKIPEAELFIANNIPRRELLERIKAANLFVLNTGYEGLSHQLLEVMSVGTPIITTNIGGNPELIENGKEGLLVPYNDKEALTKSIMVLLLKPEYGIELAKKAQEKVAEFNVKRMIEKLATILV